MVHFADILLLHQNLSKKLYFKTTAAYFHSSSVLIVNYLH